MMEKQKLKEKVIEIDNDKVRISNLGTLELADDFELYDIYAKPYCEDNKNVMLGHKSMELFIDKDNYLVAGIINDDIAKVMEEAVNIIKGD